MVLLAADLWSPLSAQVGVMVIPQSMSYANIAGDVGRTRPEVD